MLKLIIVNAQTQAECGVSKFLVLRKPTWYCTEFVASKSMRTSSSCTRLVFADTTPLSMTVRDSCSTFEAHSKEWSFSGQGYSHFLCCELTKNTAPCILIFWYCERTKNGESCILISYTLFHAGKSDTCSLRVRLSSSSVTLMHIKHTSAKLPCVFPKMYIVLQILAKRVTVPIRAQLPKKS